MASPAVLQQDVVHVDNHPPPAPGVIRQQSQSSTSRSTPQSDPRGQVQPAVAPAAGTETIETRSGASSMPTRTADGSVYFMESVIHSVSSFVNRHTPEKLRPFFVPGVCGYFVLGWIVVFVVAIYDILRVELIVVGMSLPVSAILRHLVKRGIWARQPDIPIEEGRRNPYRDNPSPNGGDIMEPPCTQPQQPPTEQVFQAEVHNPDVPISPSIPSTSAAATGVNPQGGSGVQSSTPSTADVVVASVDVHATSLKTGTKDDSVKDS